MKLLLVVGMLVVGFVVGSAPTATAREPDVGYSHCGLLLTLAVGGERCEGYCHGPVVMVGSDGNCQTPEGVSGPGANDACRGPVNVFVLSDGNCHTQAQGDACSNSVNAMLGSDENCHAGGG